MATEMKAIIDPDSYQATGAKDEAAREVEYPVQLGYTSEPVLRLAGKVSVIRLGRRDLALSDAEWQDLELVGLPDSTESAESSPKLEDAANVANAQ